jgi:hypothetical protein
MKTFSILFAATLLAVLPARAGDPKHPQLAGKPR